MTPEAFEQLVLRLLGALGYGDGPHSRHGARRGQDGGIDGRIDEDRLGLASIYIQAKLYREQSVGRPMVQSFYGAMGSHGATKGVFLTTSSFSREASDCAAEYKDKKIVLIDGNCLTRLMIDAGVGVWVQTTYLVHRLDEDFFPDTGGIGAGAPMTGPLLLLSLRLELAPVDPLRTAHRDPHRVSRHLLAQALGPSGHVPLLDP
jgi:restriction system protein